MGRGGVATGRYTGTEDDRRRDGFIHFSTAEHIAESARRHRAGQQGLVLVAVEAGSARGSAALGGAARRRAVPAPYGPLIPVETASVEPLPLGPDGEHICSQR